MRSLANYEMINPGSVAGALLYGALFLGLAALLARFLRLTFQKILKEDKSRRFDRTVLSFLSQFSQIAAYGMFLILYAHLIPILHSLATALLAGASVISIVLGLAAQNTLGNFVAGIAVLLYRPFGVGDTIEVPAPGGRERGVVDRISLGYTVLITDDGRRVMVPHLAVMNQTTVNLSPAPPPD